jgi:hypothetical protein
MWGASEAGIARPELLVGGCLTPDMRMHRITSTRYFEEMVAKNWLQAWKMPDRRTPVPARRRTSAFGTRNEVVKPFKSG